MKREIKITGDGSATIHLPDWNESYHSKHGAMQEALHVFIKNGWNRIKPKEKNFRILEYGFGTGLNAVLTLLSALQDQQDTAYYSIEKFPLAYEDVEALEIPKSIQTCGFEYTLQELEIFLKKIHFAHWNETCAVSKSFSIHKIMGDFKSTQLEKDFFDIIYFDAFGIRVQPDLWTEAVFSNCYKQLKKGGLLTTYACNGNAKRALQNVGFTIEKLKGAPGKREMINAWKI